MAPSRIRITGACITPVAFVDPPLLNTVGVHQPYALRAIIQLDTDAGLVGLDGMVEVAQQAPMPLATNMCVVAFDQLAPAVAKQSVRVVLSDHHYWGGLQRSRLLAGICENFGFGLSMHSNSHLGISLAAMVHLAGATSNLTYACDTHWPWKAEEIIKPGALPFVEGSVAVPTTPGLGVEIDEDALAALHEQYLRCGIHDRDDTGYMKSIDPAHEAASPRW